MKHFQMLFCGTAVLGVLLIVLPSAVEVNGQAAGDCKYLDVLALPDIADCTKYYRCDEKDQITDSYNCEYPFFFNPKTMGCESPELVDCELPTL